MYSVIVDILTRLGVLEGHDNVVVVPDGWCHSVSPRAFDTCLIGNPAPKFATWVWAGACITLSLLIGSRRLKLYMCLISEISIAADRDTSTGGPEVHVAKYMSLEAKPQSHYPEQLALNHPSYATKR